MKRLVGHLQDLEFANLSGEISDATTSIWHKLQKRSDISVESRHEIRIHSLGYYAAHPGDVACIIYRRTN